MDRDIMVIGGGPGGYVAAIRAAQLGANVTLIEEKKLGGTCLNWGCIPTKALYKNAQLLKTLDNIEDFGIRVSEFDLDIEKMQDRKESIVNQLVKGIQQLLKANGVEVIIGKASFIDANTIEVKEREGKTTNLKGENILISTGSTVSKPPIPGSKLPGVITSDELLEFKDLPKRLVIIGGGVIGVEFATIFQSFGSEVTVIEFMPHIVPLADKEISKRLALSLKKRGLAIHTDTRVLEIEENKEGLIVKAEGKKGELGFAADQVLMATGRAINVDGLNLEEIGVDYDSSGIEVSERFETNVPGVYAIGDVIGGYMLAHVASHEGMVAVENMLQPSRNPGDSTTKMNYKVVPNCIFTFPEVAGVGVTEEEAQEKGLNYTVSKFQLGANGKALTMGEAEGIVKVIAEQETNELLGVHIMSPHASDLIQEAVLALSKGLKVEDVAHTIHAHPTLSESVLEAVAGINNEAIHIAPRKKR